MSKTLFWTITIAIIALFSYAEIWGIPYLTLRDGSHTGQVTAMEDSGIFFKTVTVYFKTDAQSSQEEMYCLKDRSLMDKLESYEESKTQVTITYDDYLFKGMIYCDGEMGGIITGVKEVIK